MVGLDLVGIFRITTIPSLANCAVPVCFIRAFLVHEYWFFVSCRRVRRHTEGETKLLGNAA